MEKKLIPDNELKETRHGMENNMIEQASVCICIPNHAYMRVCACGYQIELRILLLSVFKSY